jgi:hypothetical protein
MGVAIFTRTFLFGVYLVQACQSVWGSSTMCWHDQVYASGKQKKGRFLWSACPCPARMLGPCVPNPSGPRGASIFNAGAAHANMP